MKTKEQVEDDIKSLARKRDKALLELDRLQKELEGMMESYYPLDPKYVKIKCEGCGGVGYGKQEGSSKKIICPLCQGKTYRWVERYE